MVAHGVSRGDRATRVISPEGDTSKDVEGASKYRPPG